MIRPSRIGSLDRATCATDNTVLTNTADGSAVVRCEVLECEPLSRLAFSWSAGGPVVNTRVSFRLEPDGEGTRVLFEHSGFDVSQPWGDQALQGAEFGWAKMLGQLPAVVAGLAADRN